jgi:prepilin-type N-terminal cleavage/methylation domain-containing protein
MNPVTQQRRDRGRHGFTFMEIIVSTALLATLLALIGRSTVAAEHGWRRIEQRAIALRSVENLLEEAVAAPWEEITDAELTKLALPPALVERWPRATIAASVTELDDPVPAKRVTLRLTTGQGPRERPMTLTTWVYRTAEGEP